MHLINQTYTSPASFPLPLGDPFSYVSCLPPGNYWSFGDSTLASKTTSIHSFLWLLPSLQFSKLSSLPSHVKLCRYTAVPHSFTWSVPWVLAASAYYKESHIFVWYRLWIRLGTYVRVLWPNHLRVLRLCQMSSEEVVCFLFPPAVYESSSSWSTHLVQSRISALAVFRTVFDLCSLVRLRGAFQCLRPLDAPWRSICSNFCLRF